MSTDITGIDLKVIRRFRAILQVGLQSNGYDILSAKFKKTANIFVTLYPWYYMSDIINKQ